MSKEQAKLISLLAGDVFTPESRLIRIGSWIPIPFSVDTTSSQSHIYQDPRLKINSQGMTRKIIETLGTQEATKRFALAKQSEPMPFTAKSILPHVRASDGSVHLSLFPDSETGRTLREEGKRVQKIFELDHAPDLANLIVASFDASELSTAPQTMLALETYLQAFPPREPHIILGKPVIR